jgi:DNA-binding response OmpR family regulator
MAPTPPGVGDPRGAEKQSDTGGLQEAAYTVRPDVALIDIGLPRFDGHAVARVVRTHRDLRMRLIPVTGFGSPVDVYRGHRAGFDTLPVEPVDVGRSMQIIAA